MLCLIKRDEAATADLPLSLSTLRTIRFMFDHLNEFCVASLMSFALRGYELYDSSFNQHQRLLTDE